MRTKVDDGGVMACGGVKNANGAIKRYSNEQWYDIINTMA